MRGKKTALVKVAVRREPLAKDVLVRVNVGRSVGFAADDKWLPDNDGSGVIAQRGQLGFAEEAREVPAFALGGSRREIN